MKKHGVNTEIIRPINHDITTGEQPDMREYDWETDEWPEIYKKVQAADILVIAGPIWLGDSSWVTKQIIERRYARLSDTNDQRQYVFYGKIGGCLITGHEDGVKPCVMNILYSLQHIGYTIPPQSDAGWIGEFGPGSSYLDKDSGGPESDFTNRNTPFATWYIMHFSKLPKDKGGVPAYGNVRSSWEKGQHFDFESPNPEYR